MKEKKIKGILLRYTQNYKAKKKADIDELTKRLNPNKPLI